MTGRRVDSDSVSVAQSHRLALAAGGAVSFLGVVGDDDGGGDDGAGRDFCESVMMLTAMGVMTGHD